MVGFIGRAAIAAATSTALILGGGMQASGVVPMASVGNLDRATVTTDATGAKLTVVGWAVDGSTPLRSTSVRIEVTDPAGVTASTTSVASVRRTDIATAFPQAGAPHGVSQVTRITTPGTYRVCLHYATIPADKTGSLIRCRTATLAATAVADPASTFRGGLYVNKQTDAAAARSRLTAAGDLASARLMGEISSRPTALWLGDWLVGDSLESELARHLAAAKSQGTTPVFVTYAIPNRDCGFHSSGGLTSAGYLEWNRTVAASLAGSGAAVIVEPDSLAMLAGTSCGDEKARRIPLLNQTVDILTGAGLTVYLDGGNSNWVAPAQMAELLKSAGVAKTRGFATNVSNFYPASSETAYAERVSALTGGKRYVVDTSRNLPTATAEWCNPLGARLGEAPRVADGSTRLDALLWIKYPGQSDGPCNGGPAAGQWWESYALDLVRNR